MEPVASRPLLSKPWTTSGRQSKVFCQFTKLILKTRTKGTATIALYLLSLLLVVLVPLTHSSIRIEPSHIHSYSERWSRSWSNLQSYYRCMIHFYPYSEWFEDVLYAASMEDCPKANFTSYAELEDFQAAKLRAEYQMLFIEVSGNETHRSLTLFDNERDDYSKGSAFKDITKGMLKVQNKDVNVSLVTTSFYDATRSLRYSYIHSFGSLLFLVSFGICILLSMNQIVQLRESKLLLLISMSGASEGVLYLSFLTVDFCLLLVLSFVCDIILSLMTHIEANFGVLLLQFVCVSLSFIGLGYALTPLIWRSSWYKYFGLVILAAAIVSSFFTYIINEFTPTSTIYPLIIFIPPLQVPFIFHNLLTAYENYVPHTLSVTGFISGSSVVLCSLVSTVFYFALFCIFMLFNPRPIGSAPIGWKHIFSVRYWKLLFRKRIPISAERTKELLSISGISKTYRSSHPIYALKDVSFSIDANDVILLIGPNGCGKTTLLNSMTGFIHADKGSVRINGEDADNGFSDIQSSLGICFQENVFFPTLTTGDHLRFFAFIRSLSSTSVEDELSKLVSTLKLSDVLNTRAGDLSGGQKRKLCIAMALIGNPPLVVLDEPTAGIDVSTRQVIWKTLGSMNLTALVSSHSLEEAESASNRIFVMRDGSLIFNGTANDLRRQYKCGYRFQCVDGDISDDLVEAVQSIEPEATRETGRNDSVLLPVAENVGKVVKMLEDRGIGFTVTVEQLEHVMIRMIAEDE